MDGLTVFYAIGIALTSMIIPFWGGYNLNSQYGNPSYGFSSITISKKYKKMFIFGKRSDKVLKPAIYMQVCAYIYIYIMLYVITTIILRLIIDDTEKWLAWVAAIIPFGYMMLTILWGLYIGIKHNICKYLKERRMKKGKQDK